jgi:hypothetical protein
MYRTKSLISIQIKILGRREIIETHTTNEAWKQKLQTNKLNTGRRTLQTIQYGGRENPRRESSNKYKQG